MPEYRGRASLGTAIGRESTASLAAETLRAERDSGAAADADADCFAAGSPTCGPPRGDHIRVAVRVRPLPAGEDGIIEVAGTGAIAIRKDAATGGNEHLRSQQGRVEERAFDRVFGPDATQSQVYSWSCAPLMQEAVANGRSATVFVYGATGAGKTHTMFGSGAEQEQRGLIFRAIPEVFDCIKTQTTQMASGTSSSEGDESPFDGHLEVKVSFLEIYNEVVRDLLQEGGGSGQCRVLEDERRGVVKVANLVEAPVQTPDEALWYLKAGMQARTVEATAANAQSSRAHAVFTLTVERVRRKAPSKGPFGRLSCTEVRQLHSKICLIDLAGSERAAFTQNSGSSLKDGARINQSLLALANCIDALTQRGGTAAGTPRKKPPYRDSKLTLMLKGSLTCDGLVAMIANVHPGRLHFEDSNNTLEYAKRASVIRGTNSRRMSRNFSLSGSIAEDCGARAEAAGLRKARVTDEEPSDHGSATGTSSSSSSLPHDPLDTTRRRKRLPPTLDQVGWGGDDGVDVTTATSPDDCLSVISLSTPGGGESCSVSEAEQPPVSPDIAVSEADPGCEALDPGGGVGGGPAAAGSRSGASSGEAHSAAPLADYCRQAQARLGVAAQLTAQLQREKAQLDARLRAVANERDALMQDRKSLEEENERLRVANQEKDELLVRLLAGAASPEQGAAAAAVAAG